MNYRPYPNVDRALAQLERRKALVETIIFPVDTSSKATFRRLDETMAAFSARRAGKAALTVALTEHAVQAGEHVHVASHRDGVRCAGGDDACTLPRTETDAELHARFAHPAYEYRTTQGPRKQWDDAGTPPADDKGDPDPTWERNTDAGRDGWERFDYTEESYWRRPLPEAAQGGER
ncbi:hypothetical protein ACIP4S_13145 [Streptomyces chartreusis]|uniref:hypothetical protein n=1 Tax=Streptomyces chartreusis TaxID=1969 RepID=UPI0038115130